MAPPRDKRGRLTSHRLHSPCAVNILRGELRDPPSHRHSSRKLKHSQTAHWVRRHTRGLHGATPTTRMRARVVAGCGGRPAATHGSYEGAATRTAAGHERSPVHWSDITWRHRQRPMAARRVVLRDAVRGAPCEEVARPTELFFS